MPVIAGLVLSTRTVAVAPAKSTPQKTVHVTLVPSAGVSAVNVRMSQPEVLVGSGSQAQPRVTLLECQLPQAVVLPPDLQTAETSFACAVAATPSARTAVRMATRRIIGSSGFARRASGTTRRRRPRAAAPPPPIRGCGSRYRGRCQR